MIKPIHLFLALFIGFVIGWVAFAFFEGNKIPSPKKLDSLRSVIHDHEIRAGEWEDTVKEKKKELEDAHIRRIVAEKKAKEAEAKYLASKAFKPQNRKDSLVYLTVANANCDTVNTALYKVIEGYSVELDKSQGTIIALETENKDLKKANGALHKLDTVHIEIEKALVKKANKAWKKGAVTGGGIGVVITLFLILL